MWAVWFVCVCVLGGSGFVARRSAPSPGLNDINDIKTLITNMKATGQIQIYLAGPPNRSLCRFFIIFVRCMAALKHHGFMTGLLEIKQRGNVNWSPNKNLTFLWPKCQIKHRRGQISSLFERGRDHPSVFTLIIVFATTIGATIWTHTFVFFRIYTSYMIIFWAWILPDRILLNSY